MRCSELPRRIVRGRCSMTDSQLKSRTPEDLKLAYAAQRRRYAARWKAGLVKTRKQRLVERRATIMDILRHAGRGMTAGEIEKLVRDAVESTTRTDLKSMLADGLLTFSESKCYASGSRVTGLYFAK